MNNVVDRVPTEVLSNGAIRWEQFDSSGNSLGYVYLKRADEPSIEGTKINKVLFDSIADDLDSRLLTANKATQAEAEAGTNNTKYMTPLRVSQFATKNKGIKITQLDLASNSDNTIDLSNYIVNNVEKVDIVFNVRFGSSQRAITLNGTNIRLSQGGKTATSASSRNLGNVSAVYTALAKLEIYPKENCYFLNGNIGTTSTPVQAVEESGNFDSLTNIVLGRKYATGYNFDYQVSIYQYYK